MEEIKTIIKRVLAELDELEVSGIGNCGRLYTAASELDRLCFILDASEASQESAQDDEERREGK